MKIKLAIFDRSVLFVEALEHFLARSDYFSLCLHDTSFSWNNELVDFLRHKSVILIDVGISGFEEYANKIQAIKNPDTRLIATTNDIKLDVDHLQEIGMSAIFSKNRSIADLVAVISNTTHTKEFLHDELAKGTTVTSTIVQDASLRKLTEKEKLVLKLYASNFNRIEIARRLNRSPKTIDTHRANIMVKLELQTNADFLFYAARNDLETQDLPLSHQRMEKQTIIRS